MSEKRDQIMKAALKLFCENGFQHTSTANISKAADVATGTLFLYFPSKEKLINALYIESKRSLADYMQDGLAKQKTTRAKMRHVWIRSNDWALRNIYAFRFIHMFSSSPYISNVTKKEVASMSDFADKFIKAGIKEGSLAKMSVPLFFSIFDGLWTSTVNHAHPIKIKLNRQKIVDQSFEFLWKGVSK